MKNDETKNTPHDNADAAEVKRTAARRRFLKRSAGAGTGIFIVTYYHQRAHAGGKKIMTSSAAVCTSLGGTVGKKTTVIDKSTGQKVTATPCTLPK